MTWPAYISIRVYPTMDMILVTGTDQFSGPDTTDNGLFVFVTTVTLASDYTIAMHVSLIAASRGVLRTAIIIT